MVKQYGDRLIDHLEKNPGWIHSVPETNGHGLQWNSPENIATGSSGLLLFLIEWYKQFREERCLSLLESSIQHLLTYCRDHSTENYSLYTGRGGVVYVLIEYHLLKGDSQLLKEGIGMLKPAGRQYLHSRYTTDGLYSGRSGTLLVILYLYQLTGDEFLKQLLTQFAGKILSNARLSEEGIFWKNEEEFPLRPDGGMADGVAGIRYAMEIVRRFGACPSLDRIAGETKRYIDSCWVPAFQNWGNFQRGITGREALDNTLASYAAGSPGVFEPGSEYGWAGGCTGMIMATSKDPESRNYERVRHTLRGALAKSAISTYSLYEGLAGIGLFYLTLDEAGERDELREMTRTLSDQLARRSGDPDLTGGLLHGDTGIAYFLLKAEQAEGPVTHILAPCQAMRLPRDPLPVDLQLKPDAARRQLLFGLYPRTVLLMEQIAPRLFSNYLGSTAAAADGKSGTDDFTNFIESGAASGISASSNERLQDVLRLEKGIYQLERAEKRSCLQIYLDELLHRQRASEDLNKPDDWLLNQVYVVSDRVRVLKSRWNWSFDDNFKTVNAKQKENLNKPSGDFSYLYMVMADGQAMETPLGIDTLLLLQTFMRPKSIGNALREIRQYILSLSEAALKSLLLNFTEYANTRDFKAQLDDMMRYEITQWIYRAVLLPISPNFSS